MAQINKPNTHFNPVLYTGNGASNAITGVNFQPDFCWFKNRTGTNYHNLFDSVRGVTKSLASNTYDLEETRTNGLTVFGTDGFTLGGNDGNVNTSGQSYASWNWKAGGTAVSNTDGDITSSVSVNTDSGFSVVTWTGTASNATVGHGLGVVPKITIVKNRNIIANWIVGGSLIEDVGGSTNNYILLNTTAGMDTSTALYASYNTDTIGVKTDANINGSGQGMVMYCFAEKKGFSKFGSYVGNGSDDGTFVYTGFKPAFVIIKSTAIKTWIMLDNKRGSYNVNQSKLFPNDSSAENNDASNGIDFLSNGLKLRRDNTEINASGATYIYMAFAENPLVGTNNIPATAR